MDQMLDRLAGKGCYYFLDGYSGYNQISIVPEDQEKTTFTCPYGTFAFKRMLCGLCYAPASFPEVYDVYLLGHGGGHFGGIHGRLFSGR